jgi:hypothetical protein
VLKAIVLWRWTELQRTVKHCFGLLFGI